MQNGFNSAMNCPERLLDITWKILFIMRGRKSNSKLLKHECDV